jgi:predicted phage tail protein
MSKLDRLPIRGSGGGGGKSGGGSARVAVEAPDSLQSIQYAKIIDLIAEGEIVGLVDGLKSIYLDETPLQNADGTLNFSNVEWQERVGTQSQIPLIGFDGSEAESPVGVEILYDTPITRTVSNANNSAIRVTLSVPALSQQNTTNGDINGTSVKIGIDIQNNGGGFVPHEMRREFSGNGFVYANGEASNTVDAEEFSINVNWSGQNIDITSTQTISFTLQYRAVGDLTWLDKLTYSFSGKGKTELVKDVNSGYLSGFVGNTVNYPPSGSKTFNFALAADQYEFRVLKTNGSRANLVGISYGGSVSISSALANFPVYFDTISGKASSKYQRAYRIELPAPGPWDIRVNRLTVDSTSTALQNKTFWESYTEIIDVKLSYPNSALQGLKIDAKQFSSIPTRGYEAKGVLAKVPSNYDPLTRVYSGAWDGTFTIDWSDNPAWCFYDIVSNGRYGLGNYVDEDTIDKWALYEIAQYCDELVSDGFSGLEPRLTCSLYLQTQEEAYKVIGNIASIFRGMSYWSSNGVTASQDAPKLPSKIFNQANIKDGLFNYSGSSSRVRHTVALVAWNDPLDAYKQKIEYVEDAAGIARYGLIQTDVIAIGCTSRGQAHRMGKWMLYSEQNETETVTFQAAMDSVYVAPGDVIETHDTNRAGARLGGRLISATVNQLTLDAAVTLESGQSYSITCVLPDGTIEKHAITNATGDHTVINTATDFSEAPQAYAIWLINSALIEPELWRVVSIAEVEAPYLEITALSYRADKYDFVENNLILQPLRTSLISSAPPSVSSNITFVESLYLSGLGLVSVKALVGWDVVSSAVSYTLKYQRDNESEVTINGLTFNSFEIAPIQEGAYSVSVFAVDSLGRKSQPATIHVTVYGKTTPPVPVAAFSVIKNSGIGLVSWQLHDDLDVQVGGNIVVRHSPLTSGAQWEDGVIYEVFSGNAVNGTIPLTTGTYMAKAIDSSGNWSITPASFIATEGMVTGFNTVGSVTENPTFAGNKTLLVAVNNILQLSSTTLIDAMSDSIDSWSKIDYLGGIQLSGSYLFDSVLDLTTVATRRFEAAITALSYDADDFINSRWLVDDWAAIDGDIINDCDATLYISTTDDDPTGAPTWTEYAQFFVADFTCRAARFKLDLVSQINTHNIQISQLSVAAKLPA